MKKKIHSIAFVLILLPFFCSAQFQFSLTLSGGSGGAGTDLCGTDTLTISAGVPPAGLSYKWYENDYTISCNSGIANNPVLIDSGVSVVNFARTGTVVCYAVDSLDQIQGFALPLKVFHSDLNEGICGENAVNGTVDVCLGDSTYLRVTDVAWAGSISVNPGSIQWQHHGIDIPGANDYFYYASAWGEYRIKFTLSCGTTYSNAINVTNVNAPVVTINGTTAICQGAAAVIFANATGSGPYTYIWSTGESTSSITISTLGPVTVTVTDNSGCSGIDTAIITTGNNPIPIITGDSTLCAGSNGIICVSGSFANYMWSNGINNSCINIGTPGVYYVIVSDQNGCTGSATVTVTQNPLPVPVIGGNTILCFPQTITLDAGAGYAAYEWNTSEVTQTITIASPGTFAVTVTDSNGCTGMADITVTPPLAILSGDNTICSGNSTNLYIAFNGTSPFTYSYTDGTVNYGPFTTNNNPEIINVTPGSIVMYSLTTFTDANCTGTFSGNATIYLSSPQPVITGDSTLCQTQVTVLDAGPGYSAYLWSNGNTTQTLSVSMFNTYTVTVSDSLGCLGSDNIVVISQAPYLSTLSSSGPLGLCIGDSVQLFAQSPMVFYQWYRNNVLIPGATTDDLWVSVQGKYKCQSLDTSGCAATSAEAKVSIVCFPPQPPGQKEGQLSDTPKIIQLYPNPSQGIFNYKIERNSTAMTQIQVTDLIGNVLMNAVLNGREGSFDLSTLASGIYLLQVSDGNSAQTLKLIKTD